MRKYLSTLLVASVLIASCSKDAEVIREKIVSQSRPILSGQGQPDNGKGEDGDYYLDLKTAKLYGPKTQGAWGEPSLDLKGLPGTNGITPTISEDGYWVIDGVKTSTKAQGERGQNGHTPVFSVIDGYWAIDGVKTTTKAQGEQGTPGQNGTDGSKILAEDRAPQATDGVKGDYFIDKTAKIFYGPKTDAGWPTTGISLVANQVQAADYQLSEDGKTLVKWLNPKTSYIDMNLDPNLRDVTTIATGAFAAVPELRDRLSTIVIGDDVTEIQASAFHGCGALRRVELPEGLTAIAPNTFEGCISLQYINIPETVTSIGMQAFANCVKLKKITIPKGVGRFESRTFFNCTALKTLVLESPIAFNIDQVSTAFSGTTLTTIFVPHAAKQAYKDANRADRKAIIKSVVIE